MLKRIALKAAELGVQVGASIVISNLVTRAFDKIREDYID